MTDHRSLLDRLTELDPATPDRIARATRDADRLRDQIVATEVDELAARRRLPARRALTAVAAAIVAIGLIVPVAILLPLAGNEDPGPPIRPGIDPPVTSSLTIEVLAPAPNARVASPVAVGGTADVYEGTVSIRIVDQTGTMIAETFTTATCGSGCRGDFEIEVPFSVSSEQAGVIEVYEVSPMDGTPQHMVKIPVTLLPGSGT